MPYFNPFMPELLIIVVRTYDLWVLSHEWDNISKVSEERHKECSHRPLPIGTILATQYTAESLSDQIEFALLFIITFSVI